MVKSAGFTTRLDKDNDLAKTFHYTHLFSKVFSAAASPLAQARVSPSGASPISQNLADSSNILKEIGEKYAINLRLENKLVRAKQSRRVTSYFFSEYKGNIFHGEKYHWRVFSDGQKTIECLPGMFLILECGKKDIYSVFAACNCSVCIFVGEKNNKLSISLLHAPPRIIHQSMSEAVSKLLHLGINIKGIVFSFSKTGMFENHSAYMDILLPAFIHIDNNIFRLMRPEDDCEDILVTSRGLIFSSLFNGLQEPLLWRETCAREKEDDCLWPVDLCSASPLSENRNVHNFPLASSSILCGLTDGQDYSRSWERFWFDKLTSYDYRAVKYKSLACFILRNIRKHHAFSLDKCYILDVGAGKGELTQLLKRGIYNPLIKWVTLDRASIDPILDFEALANIINSQPADGGLISKLIEEYEKTKVEIRSQEKDGFLDLWAFENLETISREIWAASTELGIDTPLYNHIMASAEEQPFRDAMFEFVIFSFVLEYMREEERVRITQEMKRVLKDNGQIIGLLHHPRSEHSDFARGQRFQDEIYHRKSIYTNFKPFYSKEKIKGFFEKLGMMTREITEIDNIAYGVVFANECGVLENSASPLESEKIRQQIRIILPGLKNIVEAVKVLNRSPGPLFSSGIRKEARKIYIFIDYLAEKLNIKIQSKAYQELTDIVFDEILAENKYSSPSFSPSASPLASKANLSNCTQQVFEKLKSVLEENGIQFWLGDSVQEIMPKYLDFIIKNLALLCDDKKQEIADIFGINYLEEIKDLIFGGRIIVNRKELDKSGTLHWRRSNNRIKWIRYCNENIEFKELDETVITEIAIPKYGLVIPLTIITDNESGNLIGEFHNIRKTRLNKLGEVTFRQFNIKNDVGAILFAGKPWLDLGDDFGHCWIDIKLQRIHGEIKPVLITLVCNNDGFAFPFIGGKPQQVDLTKDVRAQVERIVLPLPQAFAKRTQIYDSKGKLRKAFNQIHAADFKAILKEIGDGCITTILDNLGKARFGGSGERVSSTHPNIKTEFTFTGGKLSVATFMEGNDKGLKLDLSKGESVAGVLARWKRMEALWKRQEQEIRMRIKKTTGKRLEERLQEERLRIREVKHEKSNLPKVKGSANTFYRLLIEKGISLELARMTTDYIIPKWSRNRLLVNTWSKRLNNFRNLLTAKEREGIFALKPKIGVFINIKRFAVALKENVEFYAKGDDIVAPLLPAQYNALLAQGCIFSDFKAMLEASQMSVSWVIKAVENHTDYRDYVFGFKKKVESCGTLPGLTESQMKRIAESLANPEERIKEIESASLEFPHLPLQIVADIFISRYNQREKILTDLTMFAESNNLPYQTAYHLMVSCRMDAARINAAIIGFVGEYEDLLRRYDEKFDACFMQLKSLRESVENNPPESKVDINNIRTAIPIVQRWHSEDMLWQKTRFAWLKKVIINAKRGDYLYKPIRDDPEVKRAYERILNIREHLKARSELLWEKRNNLLTYLTQLLDKQIQPANLLAIKKEKERAKMDLINNLSAWAEITSFLNQKDIVFVASRVTEMHINLKNNYRIEQVKLFLANGLFDREELLTADTMLWAEVIRNNIARFSEQGLSRLIVRTALFAGYSYRIVEGIILEYPSMIFDDLWSILYSAETPKGILINYGPLAKDVRWAKQKFTEYKAATRVTRYDNELERALFILIIKARKNPDSEDEILSREAKDIIMFQLKDLPARVAKSIGINPTANGVREKMTDAVIYLWDLMQEYVPDHKSRGNFESYASDKMRPFFKGHYKNNGLLCYNGHLRLDAPFSEGEAGSGKRLDFLTTDGVLAGHKNNGVFTQRDKWTEKQEENIGDSGFPQEEFKLGYWERYLLYLTTAALYLDDKINGQEMQITLLNIKNPFFDTNSLATYMGISRKKARLMLEKAYSLLQHLIRSAAPEVYEAFLQKLSNNAKLTNLEFLEPDTITIIDLVRKFLKEKISYNTLLLSLQGIRNQNTFSLQSLFNIKIITSKAGNGRSASPLASKDFSRPSHKSYRPSSFRRFSLVFCSMAMAVILLKIASHELMFSSLPAFSLLNFVKTIYWLPWLVSAVNVVLVFLKDDHVAEFSFNLSIFTVVGIYAIYNCFFIMGAVSLITTALLFYLFGRPIIRHYKNQAANTEIGRAHV